MLTFLNAQLDWVKDFFDEVQPNGVHKPSIKNACIAAVFTIFCVSVMKVIAFEHEFPAISDNWLRLLLSLAGVKAVGTIAQQIIQRKKDSPQ